MNASTYWPCRNLSRGGQRQATCERAPDQDAINRDLISNSADGLTTNSSYLLEHRYATRQIAMLRHKCRDRLGREDDNEIIQHRLTQRVDYIQPDRRTL